MKPGDHPDFFRFAPPPGTSARARSGSIATAASGTTARGSTIRRSSAHSGPGSGGTRTTAGRSSRTATTGATSRPTTRRSSSTRSGSARRRGLAAPVRRLGGAARSGDALARRGRIVLARAGRRARGALLTPCADASSPRCSSRPSRPRCASAVARSRCPRGRALARRAGDPERDRCPAGSSRPRSAQYRYCQSRSSMPERRLALVDAHRAAERPVLVEAPVDGDLGPRAALARRPAGGRPARSRRGALLRALPGRWPAPSRLSLEPVDQARPQRASEVVPNRVVSPRSGAMPLSSALNCAAAISLPTDAATPPAATAAEGLGARGLRALRESAPNRSRARMSCCELGGLEVNRSDLSVMGRRLPLKATWMRVPSGASQCAVTFRCGFDASSSRRRTRPPSISNALP